MLINIKPTFSPTLIHSLIHTDLTVNGWHRFEPLPRSHVPICLGGALIATCNLGRRHRTILTANLTFENLIFISFSRQQSSEISLKYCQVTVHVASGYCSAH